MQENLPPTAEIDLVAAIANANQPVLKRKKGSENKTVAQTVSASDPLPLGKLRSAKLREIVIEDRPRQDLGDLRGLARSLREVGLVQPPIVDAQMRLVSGHRRVEAARLLGWKEMPVRILDIEDPIALTVAEDTNRKPLTASEKYAVCVSLRRRVKEGGWGKDAFGGRFNEAEEKGRLDETLAKAVGLSRETLRKITAIQLAAEEDRERFGLLADLLDIDGKVDRHYRKLQSLKGRGDASSAAAIVVSPGWHALYDEAEARDVAKYVRDSFLAAGSDEGTVLLFPSRVESLGEAVALVKQGGFEWRATLRGSGAAGEDVWIVGAIGKKTEISVEAAELIAEGCAKGLDAAFQSAEVAFESGIRSLDLQKEAGA